MAMTAAAMRIAIFCHRWMGLAFCLLFAWWFVSGLFMMYADFPGVTAADRLAHALPLNAGSVRFPPDRARSDSARLRMFDGRPAYVYGPSEIVYADTGEKQQGFPRDLNLRTAAAWVRQPAGLAAVEQLTDADQWTVEGTFRTFRPLLKFSWPDGKQVYVSERTGEVVQYTTARSRFFAYLGPSPHWLYFLPFRKHLQLWTNVVIAASGLASVAALLGLLVGLSLYWPAKRVPYRGPKRLHTLLGLFFGVMACTWSFSGMMSMDPFHLERDGELPSFRADPAALESFAARPPAEALRLLRGWAVKELEFTSFDGEPVYVAYGESGQSRIVPVNGAPAEKFEASRMERVIRAMLPAGETQEIRTLTQYDLYYLDRERRLPLPVLLVQMRDGSRYYVDPRTAKVEGRYSPRSWVTRWLYHGLHSLDLPWLYNHRPAWDLLVIALLLGGVALAATSILLGFRVVARTFRPASAARRKAAGFALRS